MDRLIKAISFATVLTSGCSAEAVEQEIKENPTAICGATLMDNLMEPYGTEIQAIQDASANTLVPLLEIAIDTQNMDLPNRANWLVPGDLDGLGMLSYTQEEPGEDGEGFVTAYLSSTNGNSSYSDKEAGTACTDNTFAYNFESESLLLTGQCEWTGTYNRGEPIGSCYGNMYRNCAYIEGNRNNYDDCTLLTGFEEASAEVIFIEY